MSKSRPERPQQVLRSATNLGTCGRDPSRPNADMMSEDAKFALGF
jgi:hypothetical protein